MPQPQPTQQLTLWGDPAVAISSAQSRYVQDEHTSHVAGWRCYLCGDEAEGRCAHCKRWLCYPCGAGWSLVIRNDNYECQFGNQCEHAFAQCWHRHSTLMAALVRADFYGDEYPRENLERFLSEHEELWRWVTQNAARRERFHTQEWNKDLQRDFRTALNRCRRYLDKPLKKGA